jgi:hypothetical protein
VEDTVHVSVEPGRSKKFNFGGFPRTIFLKFLEVGLEKHNVSSPDS